MNLDLGMLMEDQYDYQVTDSGAGAQHYMGNLLMDSDSSLPGFTSADFEAILASGFLDGSMPTLTSSVHNGSLPNILHHRPSQSSYYSDPSQQQKSFQQGGGQTASYDDPFMSLLMGLQQPRLSQSSRMSRSSIMGIHAPSPSSAPSPAYEDVVRSDSQIVVTSPQMANAPPSYDHPQHLVQESLSSMGDAYASSDSMYSTTGQLQMPKATTYSLGDFVFHHTLGTGSFGRVHLGQFSIPG
jgi:hypothetical protein